MNVPSGRRDIEGELVERAGTPPQGFAKRLSTDIAWHVLDPLMFEEAPGIEKVVIDRANRVFELRYGSNIKPCTLDDLIRLIDPTSSFGTWRLVRAALEIARTLGDLHALSLPQGLIHPERIGCRAGSFVVLPTMAGTLPPLVQIPPNGPSRWLTCMAPEILRTRMNEAALLAGGDVYSLGRVLQLIANPSLADEGQSAAADAQRLVEWPLSDPPLGLGALTDLVARMTRRLPEQRPSLAEVLAELTSLHLSLAPVGTIRALIKSGKLNQAATQLQALVAAPLETSKSDLCLLHSELALARTPPDFSRAIAELNRACEFAPKEPGPRLALGEAYLRFTAHPQHGPLALDAFWKAAELSGWRVENVARWREVARALLPAEKLIPELVALSREVGVKNAASGLSPEELVLFRLRIGDKQGARDACLDWCCGQPFDEKMLANARLVAAAFPPTELMRWMYQTEKVKTSDLMQGVVWQANGNELRAKEFFDRARGVTEQEDDDGAI